MKTKTVMLSELGIKSWSARRVFGDCHECETLKQCIRHNDLDCAKQGLIKKKKLKAKKHYELAKDEIRKAQKLLKEMSSEDNHGPCIS